MVLELLGTDGCHLCEEAETIVQVALQQNGRALPLTLTDIADHPLLMEAFGTRIPVLRVGEDKCLAWPFSHPEVTDFLAAAIVDRDHPLNPEQPS